MTLDIQHIHKNFSGLPTLIDIDLQIQRGELVCLLGPSGCGKTTLLRIVAGLLAPDSGGLALEGQSILEQPARDRHFGIVFQSYSLFPNLSVADNIAYGLRLRKVAKRQQQERVHELLSMIGLPTMAERFPGQLSGGQQQRVALARALATEPKVLLLDEPLSALDARVRAQLRTEIRDIQQRLQIPTLMVTHDQEEAMGMADRIVCMQAGRIAQIGTARALYQQPVNRFVAEFMGHSNLLSPVKALQCWPGLRGHLEGLEHKNQWLLCVRPEHLHISPAAPEEARADGLCCTAQITQVQFVGSVQRLQLRCADVLLWCECAATTAWNTGDWVSARIGIDQCIWVAA